MLLGNGDGTFRPFRKADRGVALAVADLDGDGRDDFVFASQALDRVSVAYGNAHATPVADRSGGLLAPGAVVLADLTGDGHRDLIVANSGSNNVLIYPGLGNGQFGPALNDGNGFFAGTNPVGITVADVDLGVDAGGQRDGVPDLVVANRGSNDVSILLGRRTAGGYTLVPGPRLRTGFGPVGTVVQDVVGDSNPDIVVSNSLSNDVRVVRAVGGGFFDDDGATILPVGNTPGPVMVGDFDRTPGLDLVTLNRGSDDLTLIPDFAGGTGIPRSLSSGGLAPVAGLAGDFNSDGLFDLVVANNGDGSLALFLGGDEGLSLSDSRTSPDLPHPSALALDSFGAGLLSFYTSTEGVEAATLLTFILGIGDGLAGPSPPSPFLVTLPVSIPSIPTLLPIATLIPPRDSALSLIATLLTVALDVQATPIDTSAFQDEIMALVPLLATPTLPPAQAAVGSDATGGTAGPTDASGDPPAADADPAPETPPAWVRLLVGLEEALERSRRASHDEVFPGDEPAGPAARLLDALDVLLDRWSPSILLRGSSSGGWRQAGAGVVRAIDEVIRSLWPEGPRPSPSVPSGAAEPAAPVIDETADTARPHDEHPPSSAEPVSVSLVVATALLAFRIAHPRQWRQGRRKVDRIRDRLVALRGLLRGSLRGPEPR